MRRATHLLAVLFVIAHSAWANEAQSLFDRAITEIGAKSPVPIYLPTVIPEAIAKYGVRRVHGDPTADGYAVSLYYSEETSDATLAAVIFGSTKTFQSLPNTVIVHLSNGVSALFRPVQCGGSCGPANLWWQMGGAEYSIQAKLSRSLSQEAQKQVVVEMANSMSLVR
jgi:hypothetical protein